MPSAPAAPANVREPMTRLPGRVATLRLGVATTAPRSTLWLAASHVLQVNSGPMRDDYRRFYYRDIQALQLRRTPRGMVYNLVLGFVLLIFALIAAVAGDPAAQASFALFAIVVAVLLGINALRGPTVHCLLRTAVGFYPLPSLSRLRPARRAFARLRERVEAVQGTLSDEAVAARVDRAMRERQNAVTPPVNFVAPAPVAPAAVPSV